MSFDFVLCLLIKFVKMSSIPLKNLQNISLITKLENQFPLMMNGIKNILNYDLGPFTHRLPIASSGSSTLIIDDYLILFGGCLKNECYNDIHINDLKTKIWYLLPTTGNKPYFTNDSQMFFHNSTLYVISSNSQSNHNIYSIFTLSLLKVILS